MTRDRRSVALILAAIALGTLQLAALSSLRDQGYFDKYLWFADRLLAGDLPAARIGDFSPAYTAIVAAARLAGLGYHAIRALQVACVALSALLLALTARRFVGAWAWIALLAVFTSRGVLVNAGEVEPETLLLLLNSTFLFFMVRPGMAWGHALAGGAALGLSAVTRPVAVPLILLTLLILWFRRSGSRSVIAFAAAAALPLIVVLGFTWRTAGTFTIMDPGAVLYEGMSPIATGYAGVQPRIVTDLEGTIEEPDAIHVTYRLVPSRDRGRALSRDEANAFWKEKAVSFMRIHPGAALSLVGRKLFFALHSYEAFDLVTMWRKTQELRFPLFVPFSLLILLAITGTRSAAYGDSRLLLWSYAAAYGATLIVFYGTVRHRNALVPALALMAAYGASSLGARLTANRLLGGVTLVAILLGAGLLTIDYRWQREDRHGWAASEAARAFERGAARSARARALAATYNSGDEPPVEPGLLRQAALQRLRRAGTEAEVFDVALALLGAGDHERADALLLRLEQAGYRPIREARTTSSVAYHRALAALRRRDFPGARILADRASTEAPGDSAVLALRLVMDAREGRAADARDAETELFALHDRFTAAFALAGAHIAAGDPQAAAPHLQRLQRDLPEWRPRLPQALGPQPPAPALH